MELIAILEPTPELWLRGAGRDQRVSLATVDWSQAVAVIVDLGEQPTGGYAVAVVGVRQAGPGQIDLEVEVSSPAPGDMVSQAITRPYALVTLARQDLGSAPFTLVAYDRAGQELARRVVAQ